jgi:Protein of unknown function (DUF1573)
MKPIFIFFALLGGVCAMAQKTNARFEPLTIQAKPLQDTVDAGKPMSVAFTLTNHSDDTLIMEYENHYLPNYTNYYAPLTPALPLFLLPKQVFKTIGTETETGYNGNSIRNMYIRYAVYKAFRLQKDYMNAATTQFAYYTKSPRFNKIEFAYTTADRQNIPHGGNGYFVYPFKNTGNEPLIISSARSSCGCLVTGYPKEPIMPNEWAMIDAVYDSKRTGPFTKTVTVWCNDKNQETITLTVKGSVEIKKIGDTVLLESAILAPKPNADSAKIKVELVKPLLKFYNTNFEKSRLTQNEPYTFYVVYEDATQAYETLSVLSQSPEISAVRFRKHVLKTSSRTWDSPRTAERLSIIEIDYNTKKIGAFDSNIILKTSDSAMPTVRISLKGLILESGNTIFIKK